MTAIASTLETIVNADAIYPWERLASDWQTRLSQAVAPATKWPTFVYPSTVDQLAEVLTCANREGWRVLPCGGGSKLAWGGLAQSVDVVVSTARLNRLIDHAVGDMTLTAEAGIALADVQRILAQHNQFLTLNPIAASTATLGGMVATADAGSLRHRYGGVRDVLIGLSVVRADGQVAKAGGRVVKNVAGYDLMKLFTGSWGTLGILSQLTFRVYPQPEASQSVVLQGDVDAIARLTQTLLASALAPTQVDLLSSSTLKTLGFGNQLGLAVRFQSIPISIEAQSQQLVEWGKALGISGQSLTEADDQTLWQQLQELWDGSLTEAVVTCKIGVVPSNAVSVLDKLNALAPLQLGQVHAGVGLGRLCLSSDLATPELLASLRQLCEAHSGFLTVLQAPPALKQQVDMWGYSGNALPIMQRLKQQFDPKGILSPGRFLPGI
ncbi:FAD-binding oxidoreductase [Leptolyngbya sp. AN02str]|uniref:FAD-binding oxidoreductase n=1 Tax=Leptolyngbya sp. AN02str TaxID=3423363 RepID=UPI003D321246